MLDWVVSRLAAVGLTYRSTLLILAIVGVFVAYWAYLQ